MVSDRVCGLVAVRAEAIAEPIALDFACDYAPANIPAILNRIVRSVDSGYSFCDKHE